MEVKNTLHRVTDKNNKSNNLKNPEQNILEIKNLIPNDIFSTYKNIQEQFIVNYIFI